jgi:hypothetical protein
MMAAVGILPVESTVLERFGFILVREMGHGDNDVGMTLDN